MNKFLYGIDGEQSSKRLFTLILVILWVIYFFANLFWGLTLKATLEEYMFYMIVASMFTVLAERFTTRQTIQQPPKS